MPRPTAGGSARGIHSSPGPVSPNGTRDETSEVSEAPKVVADQVGQSVLLAEAMVSGLLDQLRQAHTDLGDKIALLCKENSSLQKAVAMRNGAGHFWSDEAPGDSCSLPWPEDNAEGHKDIGGDAGFGAAVPTSKKAARDGGDEPTSPGSQDNLSREPSATFRTHDMPINPIWEKRVNLTRLQGVRSLKEGGVVSDGLHSRPEVEFGEGCCRRLISFPGSPFRLAWDLIGFVFILYDLIMIPLRVFSPPSTAASEVMDWTLLIYWTVNVIMSLLVGYVHKGITIMIPRKIIRNYFRTWFIVDVMVLAPDWYITMMSMSGKSSGAEGASDAVKLLRIMRLTKCLRLLRAAKLRRIIQQITDRIDSEYTGIFLNIVKMILLLLIINHYIASMWYVVGTIEDANTWVKNYGYTNVEWYKKYAISFHWGITQFTPASKVPLQPRNLVERSYALFVVIFALVGFSYIVGSITGSLSQLRAMAEDADKQFYQVRRYLRQNEVPKVLGSRIQRYLEHAYWKRRKRTRGDNIPIFGLLSESLHSQLQLEIALPCLKVHPLFLKLSWKFMPTLQRITNFISSKSLAVGEVLFFCGEEATHTYFLENGRVEYTGMHHVSKTVDRREAWITEQVLWTTAWHHTGYAASALMETEVLLLSPSGFSKTVSLTPSAFSVVSTYAQKFMKWLNSGSELAQHDLILCEEYETILPNILPDGSITIPKKAKTRKLFKASTSSVEHLA